MDEPTPVYGWRRVAEDRAGGGLVGGTGLALATPQRTGQPLAFAGGP